MKHKQLRAQQHMGLDQRAQLLLARIATPWRLTVAAEQQAADRVIPVRTTEEW